MARELGLGQRFDLPVVSQSYGTIPDSAWKRRRYNQSACDADWTESDTLNAVDRPGLCDPQSAPARGRWRRASPRAATSSRG